MGDEVRIYVNILAICLNYGPLDGLDDHQVQIISEKKGKEEIPNS